jgi:hypothetical protein
VTGLPQAERAAVVREAGVSARTGQVYVQIAERWPLIEERLAQRAAAPASIRAALALIAEPKTRRVRYTLKLDNPDPMAVAHAVATVRGRSVVVTIQTRESVSIREPRQQRLF